MNKDSMNFCVHSCVVICDFYGHVVNCSDMLSR